jgi:DNA replication protein DnaC
VRDTIAHIINCRYNEKKLTIFTSNYLDTPSKQGEESLTDRIGARLRSRLFEMCTEIDVRGEDFRQEVKKGKYRF